MGQWGGAGIEHRPFRKSRMNTNNQESSLRRKVVAIVAPLVICISVGSIIYRLMPHPPKEEPAKLTGFGEAMARETAKVIQGRGRVAAILPGDYQTRGTFEHEIWRAFQKAIKQNAAVELGAPETANASPAAFTRLTRPQLDAIIKTHLSSDALVLFCELPFWDEHDPFEMPRPGPKLVVFDTSGRQLKRYFEKNAIAVGITVRFPPRSGQTEPQTPAEFFDREFQVMTSENFQSLNDLND